MKIYDCIIAGGGPAGLNAAVVLGRCQRKVLVFDTRSYRNKASHGIHNYLTRDGIKPNAFIKQCQEEVRKYGVRINFKKLISARKNKEGLFIVKDEKDVVHYSRFLLVATGLTDNVPAIPGFRELYGISVFHCPYCDGWEVRNKKLGVYANSINSGWELALSLKGWSNEVTLFTNGPGKFTTKQKALLLANRVAVNTAPIAKLHAEKKKLKNIVFKNGQEVPCDAIFFVNGFKPQCDLADTFGCKMDKNGVVKTNLKQQTDIDGLYVVGDASRDMQFVVIAASEGAKAAVMINKGLQKMISQNLPGVK